MILNDCAQAHTCVITFVCVRVCAYVSVCLCACAHVWLHGYTDLCTFASIYVSTSARVILCMYASMDAWMDGYTNAQIPAYIGRRTDRQTGRQTDGETDNGKADMQACIHTCIHMAHLSTHIRTYVTHVYTYIHTCIHTHKRTCINSEVHTCIHAGRYAGVHRASAHVYMHVCLYPCEPYLRPKFHQKFKRLGPILGNWGFVLGSVLFVVKGLGFRSKRRKTCRMRCSNCPLGIPLGQESKGETGNIDSFWCFKFTETTPRNKTTSSGQHFQANLNPLVGLNIAFCVTSRLPPSPAMKLARSESLMVIGPTKNCRLIGLENHWINRTGSTSTNKPTL